MAAQEQQRQRVVALGDESLRWRRHTDRVGRDARRGPVLAAAARVALRNSSVRRRDATVINHARGLSGTPCSGHCRAAASSASWTASSQASNWP